MQTANETLEQLREITLPEPVGYFPQTAGWYVAGVAILLLAAWLIRSYYRHWKRNRYRSSALRSLDNLQTRMKDSGKRPSALASLPVLVKQVALSAFPREAVARLNGRTWLEFLDTSYGGSGFTIGPGRLLPELAYAPGDRLEDISQQDVDSLVELLRQWISKHRATAEPGS